MGLTFLGVGGWGESGVGVKVYIRMVRYGRGTGRGSTKYDYCHHMPQEYILSCFSAGRWFKHSCKHLGSAC